jgi:Nucleotidyltransferase domain/HicB family
MAVDIVTFLLRLPRELHDRTRKAASDAGISMNAYCIQRLGAPALTGEADELIGDAVAFFRRDLLGVIEYGSLARGEATDASDADLLIVIDRHTSITRDLYRRWDSRVRTVGGRNADAHFAHLPNQPTTGGIWAEAAIEGRVLFEHDRQISHALADIRRDIADGRLLRRRVHGQTYWTAA